MKKLSGSDMASELWNAMDILLFLTPEHPLLPRHCLLLIYPLNLVNVYFTVRCVCSSFSHTDKTLIGHALLVVRT